MGKEADIGDAGVVAAQSGDGSIIRFRRRFPKLPCVNSIGEPCRLLSENHHSKITLEQLAQQLFVSPAHLSKSSRCDRRAHPLPDHAPEACEEMKQEEWTIKVAQAVIRMRTTSANCSKILRTAPSQVAKEQRTVNIDKGLYQNQN
jgi:hypothetical protein